jgi:hypothetical protein
MNMRMRSRTFTAVGVLFGLALGAVPAHAQGGGTGAFRWYVGGQGGVLSFRTNLQDRQFIPAVGGHVLITAKRTGLLLSVDQAFGSDELTSATFQVVDTTGSVIQAGTTGFTFQGLRKYSAILLAYPVRNRTVQPFVGLGVGILHTTTNSAGYYADGSVESTLGSSGFGSAVGGLEFRVGAVSAFGMWQVTTKSGFKQVTAVIQRGANGKALRTRYDYGEFMRGATHTLVGGLRFSLGSAREPVTSTNSD